MTKFKPDKLRVNLKLVINRLKLLEKKKSESYHKISHRSIRLNGVYRTGRVFVCLVSLFSVHSQLF